MTIIGKCVVGLSTKIKLSIKSWNLILKSELDRILSKIRTHLIYRRYLFIYIHFYLLLAEITLSLCLYLLHVRFCLFVFLLFNFML